MINLLKDHEETSSAKIGNLSDVSEIIEAEQNMSEINEIQLDIASSVIALESCMAGADVLEGNIANEDALIENGEGVTLATVAQSERALVTVRRMLGDTGYEGTGIDNQSAAADPMGALVLGNEDAKETFKKIMKSIVEIFKRIVNSTKKVIAKIVVALSRAEKKALALKKAIKDSKVAKPNAKVLEEKDAERLYRSNGGYTVLAKGSDLGVYLKNVTTSVETVEKILEEYHNLVNFTSSITDSGVNHDGQEGITDADKKTGAQKFTALANVLKELEKPKFDVTNLHTAVGEEKDSIGLPVFAKGKSITFVKVSEELADVLEVPPKDLTEVADTLKKIKLGVEVLAVEESDNDKVDIMDKAKLKTHVDEILKAAKGSKKYLDATMKTIDKNDKKAKDLAKKATGNTMLNRMTSNFANVSRRFVTGLYVDSIFAYLSVTNGALSEAKTHFSYYKESSF